MLYSIKRKRDQININIRKIINQEPEKKKMKII